MRLFHLIHTRLGLFVLPTVAKGNWMFEGISHHPTTHLNTRQTSGTGGSPQFLRRAFHTCEKHRQMLDTEELAANRI